ncbi:polysaccharide biosynthesis protein [Adlercreutzia sp. ZJ141]|uniref:polysaccharide biosynthesis protein n=1 Tax=Adlercreutzia sp. ZJ141 TaxID=2709406 RepID=UPI0013EA819F|nr:nucleoside-diphosphate sugar epimerase/dehydratase [Adlercreutzia sp. ZJ141]
MAVAGITRKGVIRTVPFVIIDVAATFVAFVIASWGTASESIIPGSSGSLLGIAVLAVINVVVFAAMRMYSCLWEYASIDEAMRIVVATLAGSVVGDVVSWFAFGFRMPVAVYVCEWAIFFIVAGASRLLVRVTSGRKGWSFLGTQTEGLPRSIVVGAGETGSLTVKRMLACNPDMPGFPVALVDDDSAKVGKHVHGVKVAGTCDAIPEIAKRLGVEQIVIAAPSATKPERDRIFGICMSTGIKTVTLPRIKDVPIDALDRVALRDVEISDLLAREEVALNLGQMGYVSGKRVLVTGGGGSIGSELVRQLLPAKPSQIILFDIYENTTYELFHEIVHPAKEQGTDVCVFIGSIAHVPAISKAFELFEPQVVFHAAAHKHVPLMERNAREAIENNVFGTLNVVRLAHEKGCTHFVQISTDKAVNPTNVMGATKRMDEMIVQYYAGISSTVFTCVRFGNVLGSHGSVIPLFKRQLAEGGPITVTHKDITRYFMTIPEASRLVITAGAMARGGEVFVLNMGEPVRIYDLAVNLVKLSGLEPDRDIEIKITGLRPGEKLYEELLMVDEHVVPTENDDIMVSTGDALDLETVTAKLDKLRSCLNKDNDSIKRVLAEVVPTYYPKLDGEAKAARQ